MDRRATFFLGAALLCFALTPVGDPEHRDVAVVVGCVYVVFAALSFLDHRSRRRPRR